MGFPDSPLINFLYWLINTPGLGGVAVLLLGISIVTAVALVLRWIARAAKIETEVETYAYPTPALHHHNVE